MQSQSRQSWMNDITSQGRKTQGSDWTWLVTLAIFAVTSVVFFVAR